MTREPATEAGRALVSELTTVDSSGLAWSNGEYATAAILAIEDEARAAVLARIHDHAWTCGAGHSSAYSLCEECRHLARAALASPSETERPG